MHSTRKIIITMGLVLIIFMLNNCTQSIQYEGAWLLHYENRDVQKIDNYFRMIFIESGHVYFGYVDESSQFMWEKNSPDDFTVKMKESSFTVTYNDGKIEQYMLAIVDEINTTVSRIPYDDGTPGKSKFYAHLKRLPDITKVGKIAYEPTAPDEYDLNSSNNTYQEAVQITPENYDRILTFTDVNDEEWFKLAGKEEHLYIINTYPHIAGLKTKTSLGAKIEVFQYIAKSDTVHKMDEGNVQTNSGFQYLFWNCLHEGEYMIKISPGSDNQEEAIGSYRLAIHGENHHASHGGTFKKIIPLKKAKDFSQEIH